MRLMVSGWSASTTPTVFLQLDRVSNGRRKCMTTGTGLKRTQGGHISTLIDEFFDEVERVLGERGIGTTVVKVEEIRRSK